MADVVQFRLERMLDELEDLERRGIFTRREIAEIVKKRRNFEYKLKRPSPLKRDFLAYIEYEKQVDSLRVLRKKSVSEDLIEKGEKKKKKKRKFASDAGGVKRIIAIYRSATMRFKGDLDLWFRYLEYCRERRHGRINKVLAQVIRLHPKVPGVWIYAAAWEFDQNLNVAAARSLMQNGLRACPNSEDIWVEYLRMELTYINKLKVRKSALGEDTGSLARDHGKADEKQWRDENEDLFMPLNEKSENVDPTDPSDPLEEDSEKKVDVFREQGSMLLRTIYSSAVEALPSSMSLRKRFLEILDETDLAHSEELREEILSSMKRDFAKESEYWDWLARVQVIDLRNRRKMNKEDMVGQLNKAVEIYEEALQNVPSDKMFCFYTKFWMDVIAPEKEDFQFFGCTNTSDNASEEFTSHLLKVFEKAESTGCITEDLAYQYISFYLQLGKFEDARKLAEKLCIGKLSGAVKIWVLRVSIEMKWITRESLSPSKDDLRAVFELLQKVLTKVAISEAETLWFMAMKFFSSQNEYVNKLVDTFQAFVARHAEGGIPLSSAIVNLVLQKDGLQRARYIYKRLLASPHPSLALYRNCIELESNFALVGDNDGLVNARKLFESALTTYGQDVGLWRDYYSLEIKVGTSQTANAVHWRAQKIIKDTSILTAQQDL